MFLVSTCDGVLKDLIGLEAIRELPSFRRLEMFAQPSNGYRDPQLNIPHPRAYPSRHNGTWAPFVSDGATLPPQSTDYLKSVAGILEHASWD